MLNRFALVIHWFSFFVGLWIATVVIYNAYLNLTTVRSLDGGYDTQYLIESALLVIPISILPLLLGWLIRYILSGKVHLLPWR